MKKVHTIIAVILWAVLDCSAQQPHKNGKPFSIVIRPVREHVASGEPVEIKIRLTNTSTNAINASASYDRGLAIGYRYHVARDNGAELVPQATHDQISGSMRMRTLEPGESTEHGCVLSDEYDMRAPGAYRISVSKPIAGGTDSAVVDSNEITIIVKP